MIMKVTVHVCMQYFKYSLFKYTQKRAFFFTMCYDSQVNTFLYIRFICTNGNTY